jgi:parvulin-like peptidyl-prolyl isomerase
MEPREEEGGKTHRRKKMKKYISFSFFLALLFPLWSCSPWGGGLPDHILAQIDGEQISVEEFEREFQELMLEPEEGGRAGSLSDLKQAYLDQMIERRILVQEARRVGVKVTPEELNQAISEIKTDYPGEGFGERLGLRGVTLEEWKRRLEEKLLAEKMIGISLRYRGEIDEKEALQYYEKHPELFQVKEKIRARQIVVADGEEALQIFKRLKKGENFEKLAREKSLGPEGVEGGDLGCFSRGERPAEFDEIFSMEVGAISEVIRSPYGYHIFKLEEKIEPRPISFEEARAGILEELRQRKGEQEYHRWLKGLRGKVRVKINKRLLRS